MELSKATVKKLYWPTVNLLPLFHLSHSEEGVLYFIAHRTLGWGKLEEIIPAKHFREGVCSSVVQVAPVSCDRSTIFRARQSLSEKGLIYFEERGLPGKTSQWYRLNILGMWEVWMWWLKTNGEKATVKTRQRLREVAGIIKEFHKMKKWQVQSLADKEEYMNLEEEVANARKNSEYAKQRRKEKLATKPVTASVIPALMRDFVEEPGIVYSEGAVSKAEEKKIHGSMKNWLTYCERDGVDPREQLRKVCENWIHFSVGQLVREDGTTIVLPDRIVSFNNYFKYRREIDRWLVQDALDEDNKVIDLDEKRQERDEGGIGI